MTFKKFLIGFVCTLGLITYGGLTTKSIHAMPTINSQAGEQYWFRTRHVRAKYNFKIYEVHDEDPEADSYAIASKRIHKGTPMYVNYRGIEWAWNVKSHYFNRNKEHYLPHHNYWIAEGGSAKWSPYNNRYLRNYYRQYTNNLAKSTAQHYFNKMKSDINYYNKHQDNYSDYYLGRAKQRIINDKHNAYRYMRTYQRSHPKSSFSKHFTKLINDTESKQTHHLNQKEINKLNKQIASNQSDADMSKDEVNDFNEDAKNNEPMMDDSDESWSDVAKSWQERYQEDMDIVNHDKSKIAQLQ